MSLLEESCRQSKAFEDVVKQFEVSSDMNILGIFIVCLRINLNMMVPLSQFISVHLSVCEKQKLAVRPLHLRKC